MLACHWPASSSSRAPTRGREFELQLRGGGVGRGDGDLVAATIRRCRAGAGAIKLRDGALCW